MARGYGRRPVQQGGPGRGGQAVPGPWGSAAPGPRGVLTGHSLLVADAFIEAAAKLLAAIPADVVVTYVVQRDVAHCKADTRRASPRGCSPHGLGGVQGRDTVGFATVFTARHTDLTLRVRSGKNAISEQMSVKLMTQDNAGSSSD